MEKGKELHRTFLRYLVLSHIVKEIFLAILVTFLGYVVLSHILKEIFFSNACC